MFLDVVLGFACSAFCPAFMTRRGIPHGSEMMLQFGQEKKQQVNKRNLCVQTVYNLLQPGSELEDDDEDDEQDDEGDDQPGAARVACSPGKVV